MELRSEFELTQRSALRLFLQLAMHAESLAIKELFDILDANDDCSLQALPTNDTTNDKLMTY